MTTSSAVGELAAELLLGGPDKKAAPFSPDRFAD
jgi:glycine/D-amino acid oxidase-like deaminating enzyme